MSFSVFQSPSTISKILVFIGALISDHFGEYHEFKLAESEARASEVSAPPYDLAAIDVAFALSIQCKSPQRGNNF